MSAHSRTPALLTLLLCLPLPSAASDAATLDQVLDAHSRAMGGEERIAALHNLQLRLTIQEPGFEVEGLYRASDDGRVRIDIFADGQRVFSEGIDESGGWRQDGAGSEILGISDEGLLALQRGVHRNLRGLGMLSSGDGNVRLLGEQRIEGTDYFVLETTEEYGAVRQLFINGNNWLLERSRESKALHPDVSPLEVVTEERQSQFQILCGVLRSFKTESYDLSTGERIQSTEIIDGNCNLTEAELALARPND